MKMEVKAVKLKEEFETDERKSILKELGIEG